MYEASIGNYAEVNGLEMYYEVHGSGEPLVLLHGGVGAIEMFGGVLPLLAEGRQVIAVDLQAHGRTADFDRPLSYESMADDVGALIDHLGFERADVMGYSLGGGKADAGWDGPVMSNARLAILPATTHYDIFSSLTLASTVTPFLDAPMPEDNHLVTDDPADAGGGTRSNSEPASDLPSELAKPARRALTRAGYVRVEQFTKLTEAEVLRSHGMGLKALDQIRHALAARGQSFADGS